jgi:predicted nucleic acid-binding Zn ribbon protein
MPLRDCKCTACNHEEERLVPMTGPPPACQQCGAPTEKTANLRSGLYQKTGIFPYETTHITGDGKPVMVESLGHLRSLERKYGVCVTGFSNHDTNLDTPRDLPVGRPGGREYEGPRVPWLR